MIGLFVDQGDRSCSIKAIGLSIPCWGLITLCQKMNSFEAQERDPTCRQCSSTLTVEEKMQS